MVRVDWIVSGDATGGYNLFPRLDNAIYELR
jgi:hypothetical protein